MSNRNLFKDFLNDSFTKDFIRSNDFQMRTAISLITYWCNELSGADDEECDYDFRQKVANGIFNQCCQILKLSELYSNIFDVGGRENIDMYAVELDEFMHGFSDKCRTYIGGQYSLKVKKGSKVYIDGNNKLLNFVFLMCLRKIFANALKAEAIVSSENGCGIINFSIKKSKPDDRLGEMDDDMLVYRFDDITSFLVEKLKGEIICNEDCISVKIPASSGETLRSENERRDGGKNMFNAFSVMLAEFGEYKYY
ncbi:MAG: hypothetical protein NC340_03300 [Ruminococcus flavefaciens]|nr:hypothetical protein [Ruminococcus flavefaciens]MCM1229580.1 hypothetical protein [Ruminococcus flavefaciens]